MTDSSRFHLYERRGERFVPTDWVRGPWASGTQNGATIAGLLAQVLDGTPSRAPMVPMSLQLQFLKPVPFVEFEIARRVIRDGRRLQIVEATLMAGDEPCATATLVRLRESAGTGPRAGSAFAANLPPPESLATYDPDDRRFFKMLDIRTIGGGFDELGPGAAWFRARARPIEGEDWTPLGFAMLCADAGSGLSAIVSRREWGYPNVTLALHAHRAPRGEWLLLESETTSAGNGVAQVSSRMSDGDGPFATIHQAVILEPATPAAR